MNERLKELLDLHYSVFNKEPGRLHNVKLEDEQFIKLLEKNIFEDFRPVTKEDIAEYANAVEDEQIGNDIVVHVY